MNRILLCIILALSPNCTFAVGVQQVVAAGSVAPAAGGTENYGETVSAGASFFTSRMGYNFYTPFTTGSNASGYSWASSSIYVGTAAGKAYIGIYADKASGCGDGSTHCPGAKVCNESTGTTLAGSSFTTITGLLSCGTLAANTSYWAVYNPDDNSTQVAAQTGDCPVPVAFSSGTVDENIGLSPAWTDPAGPTINFGGLHGLCVVQYVTLNVL